MNDREKFAGLLHAAQLSAVANELVAEADTAQAA